MKLIDDPIRLWAENHGPLLRAAGQHRSGDRAISQAFTLRRPQRGCARCTSRTAWQISALTARGLPCGTRDRSSSPRTPSCTPVTPVAGLNCHLSKRSGPVWPPPPTTPRYPAGAHPVCRWKTHVRWLWLEKPQAAAMPAMGWSVRSRMRARATRFQVIQACGAMPRDRRNMRWK